MIQYVVMSTTTTEALAAPINHLLADTVATLDDAALARPIEERDDTMLELVHGFNQHTAYHPGQFALLERRAGGSR